MARQCSLAGEVVVAVPPFTSCAEAIVTLPEIASGVGVRLPAGDDLTAVGGICRHNPTRVSARLYLEHQAAKTWFRRWALVRYLDPD